MRPIELPEPATYGPSGPLVRDHVPLYTAEQVRQCIEAYIGDRVLVPRKLTAENGAKAALIGEFHEKVESTCPNCAGFGGCAECDGGTVDQDVAVSWNTIKRIHDRVVGLFADPQPKSGENDNGR